MTQTWLEGSTIPDPLRDRVRANEERTIAALRWMDGEYSDPIYLPIEIRRQRVERAANQLGFTVPEFLLLYDAWTKQGVTSDK